MKFNFKKIVAVPFGIAGMSVGMGLAGEAFNSAGLKAGGEAAGNFVAPAVNVSAGMMTIDMLRDLKKKKRSNS